MHPGIWPRAANLKRSAGTVGAAAAVGVVDRKRSSKPNAKLAFSSVDDQATDLLLKTYVTDGFSVNSVEEARALLGEQFVTPIPGELVSNVREAFGLQFDGGADTLSVLVGVAGSDDE
jgi:hypothetical protein